MKVNTVNEMSLYERHSPELQKTQTYRSLGISSVAFTLNNI